MQTLSHKLLVRQTSNHHQCYGKNTLYSDQEEIGNAMEKNKPCFDSISQEREALSIFLNPYAGD